MKNLNVLFAVLFVVTFQANATDSKKAVPVKKVCFFAYGQGSKGDRLLVSLTKKQIDVKDARDNGYTHTGTYKNTGGVVNGKDDTTYLDYNWGGEEGCNSILVDEALLKKNTKGMIKFRCRGEGYDETGFVCVDPRSQSN
jgi:hypothetical protein